MGFVSPSDHCAVCNDVILTVILAVVISFKSLFSVYKFCFARSLFIVLR